MVLGKKIPDLWSGFSENLEKPISRQNNHEICLQKYSNFHVENRQNDSAKRL